MSLTWNKNTKRYFVFLLVIPTISCIAPPVGVGIMYVLAIYYALRNDYATLVFFVCSALMQNMVLVIGAERFGATWTTLFSLSKEVMVYACIIISVMRKRKISQVTLCFLGFTIVLGMGYFLSNAGAYSKLLSIRQLLLPFVCVYFGMNLHVSKENFKEICKFIVYVSIVIAIIGLLEFFVFKNRLWYSLPVYQYNVNKGTTFSFYNGVPLNFYTWDYSDIIGGTVRRLVSIFVDPLITAHYLFLGFILSNGALEGKRRTVIKAIIFVSSLLTFSKGVYIAYCIYFLLVLVKKISYRTIVTCVPPIIVALGVFFKFFLSIVSKYLPTSSIVIHLNGFVKGLTIGGLFGNGLGTAGVITGKLSNLSTNLATESYIGVLIAQMGYLGFVLFAIFFAAIIFRILKAFKMKGNRNLYGGMVLIIAILVESLFSESSIGIVGSGMYFIYAGFLYQTCRDHALQHYNRKKYEHYRAMMNSRTNIVKL